MKKFIEIIVTFFLLILWAASLPVTILVIIWQMADESASNVMEWYKKL